MKKKLNLILLVMLISFASCTESQYAVDAGNSAAIDATSINGKWKHISSGLTLSIAGCSKTKSGTGTVIAVGTAMPAGALNGASLQTIEYKAGRYWDAYNWTYYPTSGWKNSSIVVGLAMAEDKKTFNIGTAVYTRQN